jgi:predicted DNA-binding protein
MGIRKGTILTENPKNKTIKVRLDEKTDNRLEYISQKEKKTKSEIIRDGIDIQYERLKK